jgi:hypothetical protein
MSDAARPACKPFESGCRQCGSALGGRRRVYCSDRCSNEFLRNHYWPVARYYARLRARIFEARRLLGYRCARCGGLISPRRRGVADRVEVNHRVPLNGFRQSVSCGHHQDNLEVVHRDCHSVITAEQRAAGAFNGSARRPAG